MNTVETTAGPEPDTAGTPETAGTPDTVLQFSDEELAAVTARLRRAQGQLGGVIRMLEEGRSCQSVVHQLAAVGKAVDRTSFVLLEKAIRQWVAEPDARPADIKALEKLFLILA